MNLIAAARNVPRRLGLLPPAPAPRVPANGGQTFVGIPRMPALFGRQPGPRQRPDRDAGYPANEGSTLATWVAARADATALASLLPKDFSLTEPLLIVEAVTLSGLPWLAGRGYEMVIVSVPVTYAAPHGAEHTGRLALVVWENCPDAIVSGREELGWNKLYADTMTRTVTGNEIDYCCSWGGTEFLRLQVVLNKPLPSLSSWRSGPLMHYRVFPRTGEWGRLEVEQVTGSLKAPKITATRSLRSGEGSFRFIPATWEQLPTLCHIVNKLADIPVGEVVDAGQARLAGWSDLEDMQIFASYPPDLPVPNPPVSDPPVPAPTQLSARRRPGRQST